MTEWHAETEIHKNECNYQLETKIKYIYNENVMTSLIRMAMRKG